MQKQETHTQKKLGAQISHMLKSRGVDVIFGIPGVHNQEMYRGIEEAGIKHILARHEQGAGFMADGYARATGRAGIAYVITGPGLCNILTAMGQAYSDSSAVLVIASCLDETAAQRGQLHQMLDQQGAAKTVSDWAYEAKDATAAYALIDRALYEFQTQRKRTKYIQVPINALESMADPAPPLLRQNTPALRANEADIAALAQALNGAKRPLFIMGGGAVAAQADIYEIIQHLRAACFETIAGRGCVPPEYPLHFGSYLPRDGSAEITAQADVIVAIGSELSPMDLWRTHLGHTCPLFRIDIDAEVLSDGQNATHPIHADARQTMVALRPLLQKQKSHWETAQAERCKAQWQSEVDAERPGVLSLIHALRAALPADTMVYTDMTQLAYVSNEIWPMPRAGHWHNPTGFGTLGYALPAAIGGAVARAGLPTVAIAGDYGFQYTVQELGTAVELRLSLPIILWDNGKLKEIEASMRRAQIAPNAVIAHNPDFVALAKAYGAYATAPSSLDEIAPALHKAFAANRPTLIYLTQEIAQKG